MTDFRPNIESAGYDSDNSSTCVPIASDVDCTGGKGNSREYVHGPLYAIGTDIYDPDRDGDDIGRERG
jgi:resuscitation-promoting factor RpfB